MSSGSGEPARLVVDLQDARPVWSLPDWAVAEIRAAAPRDWDVVVVESASDGRGDGGAPSAEALAAVRGAEVYLGYGFPEPLFEAAHAGGRSRLRWVHSGAAGVGSSLYPKMRRSDILLTNSAGIHAAPMAETALAMMLFFARGLDLAVRAQAERSWAKKPFEAADTPVRELAGSTLGIVGYGGIGRRVADLALGLGMRVLALKRTPGEAVPGVELLIGRDRLGEMLGRSDFLVLTVPGTAETRHLIGGAELDLLPAGAVLINLGRGGVVDEEALAVRLRTGRLRAAALDVFEREPLPRESPLWDLPNLLVTPHVSATSRGFWRRETDLIVENLSRYAAGEPLLNMVDKRAGY